jgi:hypothetical protein
MFKRARLISLAVAGAGLVFGRGVFDVCAETTPASTTTAVATVPAAGSATNASPTTHDILLDLLIRKGLVTQEEADKVKAEAEAEKNKEVAQFPAIKWKINAGIKDVELYGDVRFRFEDRAVHTPIGERLELERYRYALRLGIRGDMANDFYYGLRAETASNPRSPWVTFGTSSSGVPYQGPFGKGTSGISLGLIYAGWKPADWLELTIGKMPNPLYTTPMVWDSDINPEGAAEKFKKSIGPVDFFATFGQFVYEDVNPDRSGSFLVPSIPFGQSTSTPFLFTWQAGFKYNIDKDTSFKMAATLYNYTGTGRDIGQNQAVASPGFSDIYVGEATKGLGVPVYGASGYPTGPNNGFEFNQTGINDLLVLEFPFEFNFKVGRDWRARIFGDFAENLMGAQRAQDAVIASSAAYATNNGGNSISLPLQRYANKSYQIGAAIGNGAVSRFDSLGLVYGSVIRRDVWEARAYWQHIEQYSLDPNLIDSDFFEGRENMEGLYIALAYGFTDNVVGTVRYGVASRINNKLGTGGSNQDIPQVNPIKHYQLIQADFTVKF